MSISVIIPVFNDAKYVKDAIKSVLAQKEVTEILIVEDGSTDGSKDVCLQLEKTSDKIKIYSHEKSCNLGSAISRNLGISHSSSDFVAFLDADDYYVANRFKNSYKFLMDNPAIDMVYEPTLLFSNNSSVKNEKIFFTETRKHFSKFECYFTSSKGWIHLNATTFRRNAFENLGFFENDLLRTQDTDLILRAIRRLACRGINDDSHVAIHRIHDQVGSNFPENVRKYKIKFYRKWYEIIMSEKHHPAFIRHFLNRMLFYSFDMVYYEENATLRKIKKLWFLARMIFKDYRILFKII